MNINFTQSILKDNFYYYYNRTSHGSTLSKIVHSHLLNNMNQSEEAYKLFVEAIKSDFLDVQGGTTGEGIHAGVMAGTLTEVMNSFLGIDFSSETLSITPNLPAHWNKVIINFNFKNIVYYLTMTQNKIIISALSISSDLRPSS